MGSAGVESFTVDGSYRITVGLPYGAPGPAGYRPLYVLDGDVYFGSALELVRASHRLKDVLVVGVGYPRERRFVRRILGAGPVQRPPWLADVPLHVVAREKRRVFDFTSPVTSRELGRNGLDKLLDVDSDAVGGVEAFSDALESCIRSAVDRRFPVDYRVGTLFGHSFAGLAALHILFTRPHSWRTFLISSPSIWWSGRAVLHHERMLRKSAAKVRVCLTVGRLEGAQVESQGYSVQLRRSIARARMYDNSLELARRLRRYPNVELAWEAFGGVAHDSAPWSALSRGVPFAFRATSPK